MRDSRPAGSLKLGTLYSKRIWTKEGMKVVEFELGYS